VLGLLSDMGDAYQVLPEQHVGGHVVTGFASPSGDTLRVLLYAHHKEDTQSRSDASFEISLDVAGLRGRADYRVQEYRFDRDHNSYFGAARALRDPPPASPLGIFAPPRAFPRADVDRVQGLAECHTTADATHRPGPDGHLRLTARVAGNGLNFLVIEPDAR
jgi:hypothetical protein